jgi:RNA polymerase sigma factor (TIGR02999 family)
MKLVDSTQVGRRGRAYFFGAAARAMRQVLVEHARRRAAVKRGRGPSPVPLDAVALEVDAFAVELLDLDRAIDELAHQNSRQARVVECRYFAGMSVPETAAALDVSARTVKADWALARAWLYDRLHGD